MVKNILFLLVVFLTNIIQCITGFAGTVLAMPFSVMLVGYDVAKPVLNLLGLAASVYVVATCLRHINKKELGKMTGIMLVGMAAGIWLKRFFTGNPSLLYKTLGVIVIAFALMNAVKFFRNKDDKELPEPVSVILLILSGVVHGMFVCGGPLLVTYASGKMRDKDEFRGTLSAVWILLNGILFAADIYEGYFIPSTVRLTAISVVILAGALVIGSFISKKMSRKVFLILTYILMLISGASLLIK
ncbi:MAG: sulfite exporter TauE/SafE family protein [Clostridia bacterium]|nr:sulfite exporter TauE/SafE family protein [Clostridia bacterium]